MVINNKKTIKYAIIILLILFSFFTISGCKKKTLEEEYEEFLHDGIGYSKNYYYKSRFSGEILKIKGDSLEDIHNHYDKVLFGHISNPSDLEDKIEGKIVYKTDNYYTVFKNGTYFKIKIFNYKSKYSENNKEYYIYSIYDDICYYTDSIMSEYSYAFPFPSFMIEEREYCDQNRSVYIKNETIIPTEFKEFIKEYYSNITTVKCSVSDDKVIITEVNDLNGGYDFKGEITISFGDTITIDVKEDA